MGLEFRILETNIQSNFKESLCYYNVGSNFIIEINKEKPINLILGRSGVGKSVLISYLSLMREITSRKNYLKYSLDEYIYNDICFGFDAFNGKCKYFLNKKFYKISKLQDFCISRYIKVLFQHPKFIENLSVKENIKKFYEKYKKPYFFEFVFSRMNSLMNEMNQSNNKRSIFEIDMNDLLIRNPCSLSYGQRSVIYILLHIIMLEIRKEKMFLFADEPGTDLDVYQKEILLQKLILETIENKNILVMSTHRTDLALNIASEEQLLKYFNLIVLKRNRSKNYIEIRQVNEIEEIEGILRENKY